MKTNQLFSFTTIVTSLSLPTVFFTRANIISKDRLAGDRWQKRFRITSLIKIPVYVFVFSFLLLTLTVPCKAPAADLDIFDLISDDVAPNVLLVLDISNSMNSEDVWNFKKNAYDTRLTVAKDVVTEIINDNPHVKWGLLTFPRVSDKINAGTLVADCMLRSKAELSSFVSKINSLSANGSTPVSTALAEAGLYFVGARSFFWGTQYKSPIENECQPNYIIIMTDGFSSLDSGYKTGFTGGPILNAYGVWTDVAGRYDLYKYPSNIIFLANYLQDKNKNWLVIGDYITRKTKEGLDLGSKLAPYVNSTLWTAETNNEISGELTIDSHGYHNLFWNKIESGSPTLGDTNLRLSGQLTPAMAEQLKNDKTPYISGYNKSDPSRPFPPLTFAPNPINSNNTILRLFSLGYLEKTQIYQGNITDAGFYGSDYLDDVAAFLNNEDLRPNLGTPGTKYEKQTVKTYTIGFMFSTDLLERTAVMGGTGGRNKGFFTADDYDELRSAFSNIIKGIKEDMSAFAAPALPSSTSNEIYSGDHVYMSFFRPQEGGYWIGNVKRYTLDADHTLNSYMDNNGDIKSNTTSDWSSEEDGNNVALGGVVENLSTVLASMEKVCDSASLRRIYTYIESNNQSQLSHTSNLFIESNSKLTDNNGALLGLNKSQSAVEAAITIIRLTPMGAVIHSSPTVVRYPSQTLVFAGANDGFLHAFLDNDSAAPEAWAFVMPEHLTTITNARTNNPSDDVYYVDGHIATTDVDTQKVLITGARRGGSTYAALDITSYNDPEFLFQIPSLKASDSALWSDIPLGQSWGKPRFIETHNTAIGSKNAATFTPYSSVKNGTFILLPGGYDTRYDTLKATQIANPLGGVIVGVNAITGKPDDNFELLNSKKSNIMKHAILDLLPLDMNSDGLVDTIYYGDLGGNMFYAWPYSQSITGGAYTYNAQDKFVPYLLFKTKNGESSGRKFMFAPAVTKKKGMEYIYFGSGDSERPLDTSVQDRFYCVVNGDKTHLAATSSVTNYFTEADLADVTENLIQSSDESKKAKAQAELDASSGWYFDLQDGEKAVGTPLVYKSYVAFTTYQPKDEQIKSPLDVCQTGFTGYARLYVVDYLTGGAALGENRSEIIGTSIPSAVVLGHYADGDLLNVAVDGFLYTKELPPGEPETPETPEPPLGSASGGPKVFYWREIY